MMSKGLRSIRALAPEALRGLEPSRVGKKLPKAEWVDPRDLFVEDEYQRGMDSGKSLALIRRIYAKFAWARFKPPICVRLPESGNVLVCIDGQHTATAAACHPGISKIMVVVVDAAELEDRASSFVGHNTDRLQLTQIMIYKGELASGDHVALQVKASLEAADVRIPESVPSYANVAAEGVTVAIGSMRAVVRDQGGQALTTILKMLRARPDVARRLAAVVAMKTADEWHAIAITGREGSKGRGQAIANAWLREMNIRLEPAKKRAAPAPVQKPQKAEHPPKPAKVAQGRSRSPNVITDPEPPLRQPPPPPPAPVITQAPEETPAPPKASPPPQIPKPAQRKAPAPDPNKVIERDGIILDLNYGSLARAKLSQIARLGATEAAVIAPLLRVRPAWLPCDDIAKRSGLRSRQELHLFADAANAQIAVLGLKIKEVGKMGMVLADIGTG